MSQSPFGRVLSERELEHRRRMLAHLTSLSRTAVLEPPAPSHSPAIACPHAGDSPARGRIIPFRSPTKT